MTTPAERKRTCEVQRLAHQAVPLQAFGTGGPGRGHTAPHAAQPRPTGMTKAYLVARIARDHPDILEQMKAGAFTTVRQAAIAAGILQHPTRLDFFPKLWRNASDAEWQAIAQDVVRWVARQGPAVQEAVARATLPQGKGRNARPDGTPKGGQEAEGVVLRDMTF
jgi:hypothetical protein